MADPLPEGFTLDKPRGSPPLPPGFTLDKQTPQADVTREQRLERISQLEGELAELENQPGAFRSIAGGTLSDLRGLPEAALQLGTGAIATAAGGVAALL